MRAGRTWAVAGAYFALTLFTTWPLARGLATEVPWDLGDSLLNMWILSWDCEQIRAVIGGDLTRIGHFFDGNIFYPARLTLAYSEHLFPQALQGCPVYFATRNPILTYNLLFLSTFVLSGVGAYLLVRELTGDWRAAFVAGILFAFAPYRIVQAAHLQVLSSQWMPFTLYGLARYFKTRHRLALAGGAAALTLQNLSCGYYLLYFAPFAGAFVLWEVWRRALWRDRRLWAELSVALVAVILMTAPFLVAYARAQRSMPMTRGTEESIRFSADVFSYFTALGNQNIWGHVALALVKDEGQLFPGALPVLLSLMTFAAWILTAWRAGGDARSRHARLDAVLMLLALASLALAGIAMFERRLVFDIGVATVRISDIGRVLAVGAACVALAAVLSARTRARLRALVTPEGFFCLAVVAAWWLSLGPRPSNMRVPIDFPSPYAVLHHYVPGFEGMRVPARYAMVVVLMMAVASGFAVARIARRRLTGTVIAGLLSAAFVVEAHPTFFTLNGQGGGRGYLLPEARIYPPARAPRAYRRVAALPAGSVLLEMPLGDPNWDLRYVYYAATHWRPIVNGYSGFFPPAYGTLTLALTDPDRDGDLSWRGVLASGATHLLVHERAFKAPEVEQITRWLRLRHATELFRDGTDALYTIPR